MAGKRLFDFFFASIGLLMLSPLLMVISVWIKWDSSGPIFFRQVRIGQYGQPFRIIKFRTMVSDAELKGAQITSGDDVRITRIGHHLRHYKLDELPQLVNVLMGEMSFVGPRPEVPRYVEKWPADVRNEILSVRPGITDFAAIEFKDENALLSETENPEKIYVEQILPIKIRYYLKYVHERSLWVDMVLIFQTLRAIVR